MATKPTDGAAYEVMQARRAKVAKPAKPAKPKPAKVAAKRTTPARATARKAAPAKAKPAKAQITPEARAVYMTMDGVPKTRGLPTASPRAGATKLTPTPVSLPRAGRSAPTVGSTMGFQTTNPANIRVAGVKSASISSTARPRPTKPPVKRPQ